MRRGGLAWVLALVCLAGPARADDPLIQNSDPRRPPAPPPPPPPVVPRAQGVYTTPGFGFGGFFVFDRGAGREPIERFAVNVASELGYSMGPYGAIFLSSSVTFHHYDTVRDYAKWVFKDTSAEDGLDLLKGFFLAPTVPVAALVDTQFHLTTGFRVYFAPTVQAPFVEVGGGLSLLVDRPDGIYGGGRGALGGFGCQVADHASVAVRGYWSPTFNGDDDARGGAPAVTVVMLLTVH